MDKVDYVNKANQIFDDREAYAPLAADPTKKQAATIKKKANELARLELISPDDSRSMTLNNPRIAQALISLELLSGAIQYPVPSIEKLPTNALVSQSSVKATVNTESEASAKGANVQIPTSAADKPKPAAPSGKSAKPASGGKDNDVVDVSRLDMRVGKILEVSKHPDADTLYVEKVDLGEAKPRTIISGLVRHVPLEKMQNLVGIFMCNLKPVKMRGIESQGMLMCATASDGSTCEPLEIHGTNIALGDHVFVDGYPGEPDAQLNPKKKIFESVKPDLRVDAQCIATYKGSPWKLKGNPSAIIRTYKAVHLDWSDEELRKPKGPFTQLVLLCVPDIYFAGTALREAFLRRSPERVLGRHLSLCEFASAELPVKFWRLIRQYPYIFWLASFRTEISKLLWSGRLSGAELFPNYGLPGCRIPFQLNRWCTSPP
nr:unnamed protein product [Spirometra erinaceieuropaei]